VHSQCCTYFSVSHNEPMCFFVLSFPCHIFLFLQYMLAYSVMYGFFLIDHLEIIELEQNTSVLEYQVTVS